MVEELGVTAIAVTVASVIWRVSEAVLPAMSVAVVVIVFWPANNGTTQVKVPPLTVAGTALHIKPRTPDRASLTVPLTDTEGVMTEAPFAGAVIATSGAVVSSFTVASALFWLPTLSVAVPLTT